VKTLALLLLLAAPSFGASTGTVETARIRLKAEDLAGALADAETAVARGGGAEAYAARADAKLALGRPLDEVIADYAPAVKLDPRYAKRYQGLVDQKASLAEPRKKPKHLKTAGENYNGLAMVLGTAALGLLLVIVTLVLVRGRDDPGACRECEPSPGKKPPEAS
jgi:hypothetical protein